MKILFVAPYPQGEAGSQRFRFEQFFELLKEKNIDFVLKSFWSICAWKILYQKGKSAMKIWGMISGFTRRVGLLFTLRQYDFIFLHREATPVGPAWWEWCAVKIFGRKIIYDFDDAIWLPNVSEQNRFASQFKFYSKVKMICRIAYKVSPGNEHLCRFSRQFNNSVILFPTVVDTGYYQPMQKPTAQKLRIGWTGSHSTNQYLPILESVLEKLSEEFDYEFIVISNQPPPLKLSNLRFIPWKKESEVGDLNQFDIGVMPLVDSEWERGKCGFKLIQYLALGIPAVCSPVAVNTEIIHHGENGFHASNEAEWYEGIKSLLQDKALRKRFGENGRKKILDHYSVKSQEEKFINLFR